MVSDRQPRPYLRFNRALEPYMHASDQRPALDTLPAGNPKPVCPKAQHKKGGSASKFGAGIVVAQATTRDPIRHPKPHGRGGNLCVFSP